MNDIYQVEKVFKKIQDKILDEYNNGTISKREMINISKWCENSKAKSLTKKTNLCG